MKTTHLFIIALFSFSLCLSSCDKKNESSDKEVQCQIHSENELKIVAEITLKPNAMESMRPVFEKVIAASQAEEGCIYYDLHKNTADTTNTKFVMLETWKDQAAIDLHNESQHFKTFVQTAGDYIDDMKVTVLKIAK